MDQNLPHQPQSPNPGQQPNPYRNQPMPTQGSAGYYGQPGQPIPQGYPQPGAPIVPQQTGQPPVQPGYPQPAGPAPIPQQPGQPGRPPVPQGAGPVNEPAKQPKGNPRTKWIILGVFALAGIILGIMLYQTVNRYVKQMSIVKLPGLPIVAADGTVQENPEDDDDDLLDDDDDAISLTDLSNVKGEAWDGKSRITCLAMGLDYRDWEAGEKHARSDSMMLVTYDPVTGMAGMLSMPRDLWVAIPNHGYGRINTAYYLGEAENLPGGGPQLAMETVELFLGIDIQYYAVVNFEGFIDFIDAIDKLAIHVKEDITIDPIGPNNTVTLRAGVQDLDGAHALAYARHRYSEGGDFERAQRQQDVLYALYEQLIWQLPELLMNPDDLYAAVTKAFRTNLTISDMIKLAWTVTDLEPYEIVRSVIAPPYQVDFGRTEDGTQQILIPIPDKIREARDVIFGTSRAASPAVLLEEDQDESILVAKEAARITLMNGTSEEVFNRTVSYLQAYGITIVNQGPANNSYANSMTIITGKPFTGKFLQNVMNIPTEAVTLKYDPNSDIDFVITITDAWAQNNPMP